MGEGSAVLILEEEEHAKARGARIYAEFAGYGASSDAYHITSPNPDGSGGAAAIVKALKDANIKPEEVDYYNAHGTSTPINDPSETEMIKKSFGEHAYKMKISLSIDDVDLIVCHQANERIIRAAAKRLNYPIEKFPILLEEYANTSSASIPISLVDLEERGICKTYADFV